MNVHAVSLADLAPTSKRRMIYSSLGLKHIDTSHRLSCNGGCPLRQHDRTHHTTLRHPAMVALKDSDMLT